MAGFACLLASALCLSRFRTPSGWIVRVLQPHQIAAQGAAAIHDFHLRRAAAKTMIAAICGNVARRNWVYFGLKSRPERKGKPGRRRDMERGEGQAEAADWSHGRIYGSTNNPTKKFFAFARSEAEAI